MSNDDSAKIVRAAYDYLVKVLLASGTPMERLSNFRVEELSPSEDNTFYKVTLSYEVVSGDFQFDRKREYKDFDVNNDGTVRSMRIRKIS